MKLRIARLLALFIAITPLLSPATPQVADFLLWNDDTYPIFEEPLEEYFYQQEEWPEVFSRGASFSHCTRGYSATFEIRDSKLYLTKIEKLLPKRKKWWEKLKKDSDDLPYEWREIPVSVVFPKAVGPIFAKWYSDTLIIQQGELLKYIARDFYYCEKEIHIEISKGMIVGVKSIDNTKKYKKDESEPEH